MKELIRKELGQQLNSLAGYVVPALFVILLGYLFLKDVFVINSASMKTFCGTAPWLLFLFIPALALRTFSEEKRTNTLDVLLSLPITERALVAGKMISLTVGIAYALLLTLPIPLILGFLAGLSIPEIIVGYMGVLLLGIAYLSFSMYVSSRMNNQITAFLTTTLVLFLVTTLSSDFLANLLPKTVQDILLFASPTLHLDNFAKGVIDMRSVVYFAGIIYVFFELTVAQLKKRP